MFFRFLIVITTFLIINKTSFSLNPEKDYKYNPKQFGLSPPITLKLRTGDGFEINTWHFKTNLNKSKTTIVLVGGDAGNMSYSLFYVKRLIDLGYDVVTFDYRGFGESSDFNIDKDYLFYSEFSIDLETVITYLQKQNDIKSIGLMSFSMGTIITCISYNKIQHALKFIISENFVINPYTIKDNLYLNKRKKVLIPKEVTKKKYDTSVRNINVPMLMFFGKQDLITTAKEGRKLNEILTKKGTYVNLVIHDGGHGEGLLFLKKNTSGDLYFEFIENFILKNG